MYFNTVIIGGGLAGLTAGMRILASGKTCALLNAGQGALHFSSGAFDFLGALPNGQSVQKPLEALQTLTDIAPQHPYSLIGINAVERFAIEAEEFFRSLRIEMRGSLRAGNHMRVTPLGSLTPTWLSSRDAFAAAVNDDASPLWEQKRALVVSIKGYLDCPAQATAHALKRHGLETVFMEASVPALEERRKNSSEFRSINISRIFERQSDLEHLANQIRPHAAKTEVVLLPACIGTRDASTSDRLEALVGKSVRLIPTMPPSLLGARVNAALSEAFVKNGGVMMPGDRALGFDFSTGSSTHINHIHTRNLENDPLRADSFLLASGSFFSKGLETSQETIREPVFNLDCVDLPKKRDMWAADSFFDDQPFEQFGVAVDASFRGRIHGSPLENVYVAGMILGNANALALGCGAGVAITSALAAADAMTQ